MYYLNVYPVIITLYKHHDTEQLDLTMKFKRRCWSSNYCKDGVAFVAGSKTYVW